jgi:DNA-binding NtrC family response regulator
MPASVNRKLLFVDDEPSIRVTLPPILRKAGFEVAVAESVTAALQRINAERFDCLVTDLNICKPSDGLEVASGMRESQPGCAIFILTGYPGFDSAVQAIRVPVDDYLIKPVDLDTLITRINERLDSSCSPKQANEARPSLRRAESYR